MANKKKQKGEVFSTRITDPDLLKWFHAYMKGNDRNPAWTLRQALRLMWYQELENTRATIKMANVDLKIIKSKVEGK